MAGNQAYEQGLVCIKIFAVLIFAGSPKSTLTAIFKGCLYLCQIKALKHLLFEIVYCPFKDRTDISKKIHPVLNTFVMEEDHSFCYTLYLCFYSIHLLGCTIFLQTLYMKKVLFYHQTSLNFFVIHLPVLKYEKLCF